MDLIEADFYVGILTLSNWLGSIWLYSINIINNKTIKYISFILSYLNEHFFKIDLKNL